jgi:hypothetical protein
VIILLLEIYHLWKYKWHLKPLGYLFGYKPDRDSSLFLKKDCWVRFDH